MGARPLILIIVVVIFGAANTIFLTLQDRQSFPSQENKKFTHPFIQTGIVFLGEFICIIPYLLYRKARNKDPIQYMTASFLIKPQCPFYIPFIPGFLDVFASSFAYISLNFVSTSVWQVTRGASIITTALFYRIFLKTPFSRAGILGCTLAFIGITLAQTLEMFFTKDSLEVGSTLNDKLIGLMFLVLSIVFNTVQLVVEKQIFNKYTISPFKMVYLEGLCGIFFIFALILLFQTVVLCPEEGSWTSKCMAYEGRHYIENVYVFWKQINANPILYVFIISLIFSIAISVSTAVTISKVINPVSRALADVCRTILIWIWGLVMTQTIGRHHEEYRFENLNPWLNCGKLVSFICVGYGTILYHEIGVPSWAKEGEKPEIKDSILGQSEGSVDEYLKGPTGTRREELM